MTGKYLTGLVMTAATIALLVIHQPEFALLPAIAAILVLLSLLLEVIHGA